MNRMTRTWLFASALAIVVGTLTLRFAPGLFGYGAVTLAASTIVAAACYLFYRQPKKPTADPNAVQPFTRKWARAMYHNGFISLEELVQFYAEHPEENTECK